MKLMRLAYKTIVNMEGSAQGHTCYMYSTEPKLALEKWTKHEGLYVDPESLEMICGSSVSMHTQPSSQRDLQDASDRLLALTIRRRRMKRWRKRAGKSVRDRCCLLCIYMPAIDKPLE